MRIVRTKNYEEMSVKAAGVISAQIALKPNSVLGLATGSTPLGIYENLIKAYCENGLDFSEVKTINLDEYKGISPENEQSYQYYMQNKLFNHINIKSENTHLPDGLANEAQTECNRYDNVVKLCGGIDLQLLGIGHNGHIGFNEPSDCYNKHTHCVRLSERTIEANKRFFKEASDVPNHAYTLGICAIFKAKCILIAACGRDKAEIIKKTFSGPITPEVPASILQIHNNVILIGDEEALALI